MAENATSRHAGRASKIMPYLNIFVEVIALMTID